MNKRALLVLSMIASAQMQVTSDTQSDPTSSFRATLEMLSDSNLAANMA